MRHGVSCAVSNSAIGLSVGLHHILCYCCALPSPVAWNPCVSPSPVAS